MYDVDLSKNLTKEEVITICDKITEMSYERFCLRPFYNLLSNLVLDELRHGGNSRTNINLLKKHGIGGYFKRSKKDYQTGVLPTLTHEFMAKFRFDTIMDGIEKRFEDGEIDNKEFLRLSIERIELYKNNFK